MKARRQILASLMACAVAWAAPAVHAQQDFPNKPITITVGYGPGDNMDLMTRMLASKAEKILGQPIVVMNKPGAAGAIALIGLATQKADGYQIVTVLDTALARLPTMRKLSYKMEDFEPVLQFASGGTGVVVKSTAPWRSFPEFVQYAKANPGKVSYTTTGPGTTMHVGMMYIELKAGVQWTHVPYPAAKLGLAAVLGDHVTAAVGSTQWAPEVRDGTLRLLAVLGNQRMKPYPDVPTLRELGFDYATDSGNVMVAPKGTPPAVLTKLNDAFQKAMAEPEYQQLLRNIHHEATYRERNEVKRNLERAEKEWVKLIADMKIPTEHDPK